MQRPLWRGPQTPLAEYCDVFRLGPSTETGLVGLENLVSAINRVTTHAQPANGWTAEPSSLASRARPVPHTDPLTD